MLEFPHNFLNFTHIRSPVHLSEALIPRNIPIKWTLHRRKDILIIFLDVSSKEHPSEALQHTAPPATPSPPPNIRRLLQDWPERFLRFHNPLTTSH
jgi:hypothetical protein